MRLLRKAAKRIVLLNSVFYQTVYQSIKKSLSSEVRKMTVFGADSIIMIKTNSHFIIIGLLLFCFSCRKEVSYEFPDFEKKITVNSFFAADSSLKIHLSLSDKMNKDSLFVIQNASLEIFIDGILTKNYVSSLNGIYTIDKPTQALKTYGCEVKYLGYDVVYATSKVPQKCQIENVMLISEGWINMDGRLCPTIYFDVKNSSDQEMYFEARILFFKANRYSTEYKKYEEMQIGLFSNMDSKDVYLKQKFNFCSNSFGSYKLAYQLELRTVSYEYYQYAQSLIHYQNGRYPEFNTSSIVPYNLFSNVESGYGIFAAYNSTFSDTLFAN